MKRAGTHLDLIHRSGRKEDNLRKASMRKGSKTDPTNDFIPLLNNRQSPRIGIIHQSCDILPRHLGELFLEECFQSGEDDE